MFSKIHSSNIADDSAKKEPASSKISPKYRGIINSQKSVEQHNTTEKNRIHEILENEKQTNKTESWNKLDKMTKIQKLLAFADRYCTKEKLSQHDNELLKQFFIQCIDQSKLIKSKEIVYDREAMEIRDIPALFLHPVHRNFTLRLIDNKRVSTLKSLAPKKRPVMEVPPTSVNPIVLENEPVEKEEETGKIPV